MPLKRFDPPALAKDFDAIPHQLDAWSDAISQTFDDAIFLVETPDERAKWNKPGVGKGKSQYYNAMRTETLTPALDVAVTWSAFPRQLTTQYGRYAALREAEKLLPLSQHPYYVDTNPEQLEGLLYRPQDEYCEWQTTRDAKGRITRVTFTSEAPEYWSAMASGYPSSFYFPGKRNIARAVGDPSKVLALYHSFVGPQVKMEDLFFQDDSRKKYFAKGDYNPYNKWNTTHGFVHLTQPSNVLLGEIHLVGDATIMRQKDNRLLVDADELVGAGSFGTINRSSDPNIGLSVNQLARLGAMVTIANPVGLYMGGLNSTGWTKPDGKTPVGNYWKIVRGRPGQILRAVYEVPAGEGFTVSDILIGGVPISWGGQLVEHITVLAMGRAFLPAGRKRNKPLGPYSLCTRAQLNLEELNQLEVGQPMPPGYELANPGIGVSEPVPMPLAPDVEEPAALTLSVSDPAESPHPTWAPTRGFQVRNPS